MNEHIRRLTPDEFPKCGNIWDMERHADLAERFLSELQSGNRLTWVYEQDGHFLGEISMVLNKDDPDYTIPGRRIYVSRLIVRKENRRQGIGKSLVEHVVSRAAEMGYSELSIGVDMDNYGALRLYTAAGFREILYLGEDADGKYFKLLKRL
jgi:ribosomal protein S18 acetylase RimI-like enzyme